MKVRPAPFSSGNAMFPETGGACQGIGLVADVSTIRIILVTYTYVNC